jgi:hypothetical protein
MDGTSNSSLESHPELGKSFIATAQTHDPCIFDASKAPGNSSMQTRATAGLAVPTSRTLGGKVREAPGARDELSHTLCIGCSDRIPHLSVDDSSVHPERTPHSCNPRPATGESPK